MPISSHRRNLGILLLDAKDESEVTENCSFGGFHNAPAAAMVTAQGRPRTGHFLVGSAACGVCVTQHKRQAHWSGGWGSQNHHEILRQGLGFTPAGFRTQSAETAALRPQAPSGTRRGTGLSRWLLMPHMS